MYPKFPLDKVKRIDTDKIPLSDLMDIWDEFRKLDVTLLPKYRTAKFPHSDFWATKNRGKLPKRIEALEYQSRNNVSGWCLPTELNNIIVVDIDPANLDKPFQEVYETLQQLSPTDFVLMTPSNGLHLYYRLDKPIKGKTDHPFKGVDIRSSGNQVITIGGINTYNGEDADKKGLEDGHVATYTKIPYGVYNHIPTISDRLLDILEEGTPEQKREAAENYAKTPAGKKRLDAHFNQSDDDKLRVVLEALGFVLDEWNTDKSYEDWLQMWMSAYHGSDGDKQVRDYIIAHPSVYWSDGEEGKDKFRIVWANHNHDESGYTVASLFWLARQSGWMKHTGYEIDKKLMKHINYRYVSDWLDTLDEMPTRLLMLSQTGSGKTFAINNLYNRLSSPKTVIFVPTRKLATELGTTLIKEHGLPVTIYRDEVTGELIDEVELANAKILVTTLQTFSVKLHSRMEDYGLVYVEESDQLLAQFARGGGGWNSSHVDDNQARRGFSVLRDAMENSGVVWFVDATMSQVTQTVAENLYDGVVEIVNNQWVSLKAPVTMVYEKANAYQKVLEALLGGLRVVFCADTAREAEIVHEVMQEIGALKGKRSIAITRNTENTKHVRRFMRNVNVWANQYDLVCYNSVMASGVSISDVEADVVVQVCNYLTPRVNLQILNRYRKQKEVYIYYSNYENIYMDTVETILDKVQNRAELESAFINMPVAKRVPDAQLRSLVGAISVADTLQQMRSPKDFYVALLERDGRVVTDAESEPIFGKLQHTIDEVRDARKAFKEKIAVTWREVPPLHRGDIPPADYTPLQVAQAEIHAKIDSALRGNIPEGYDDREIYDIVDEFHKYGYILTAFIRQELALKRSEHYLADKGRSLSNLINNVTLIKMLKHVHILFNKSNELLSPELLGIRAKEFMDVLTLSSEAYDSVITNNRQKFNIVYAKNETREKRAIAFAKILLAKIGLKLRSKKVRNGDKTEYHYHISNLDTATLFLTWRNKDLDDYAIRFNRDELDTAIDAREDAFNMFKKMTEGTQEEVLDEIDEFNDFKAIVSALSSKGNL